MGILEQTIKMKEEGIPEEEIVDELSRQGASPKEIEETLKQAQIKSAISQDSEELPPPTPIPERTLSPKDIYRPKEYDNSPEPTYITQNEEYAPMPQIQEQQYYQPEQYSPAGTDADTIIEIADQVFSDKIKKIQKQLDTTSEVAILLQTKMENISERIKRVETIIDKLQIAILEKVGSYGRNLESVKKEMSMMQDSFSKMISPSRKHSEGSEAKKK